jgi:biotin transport system substrate-specific component
MCLIEGIAGIPVFSNSPERGVGLIYFTGPTMGYLIGFISACFLASFITTKDNYFMILSKLILSTSTIYILGVIWLGILIGWEKPLIQLGVTPFLLAELTKIALLTVLAKKLLKLRKFI